MDEATAYAWVARCLRPAEDVLAPHRLQQVADRIASVIVQTYRGGLAHDEASFNIPEMDPKTGMF